MQLALSSEEAERNKHMYDRAMPDMIIIFQFLVVRLEGIISIFFSNVFKFQFLVVRLEGLLQVARCVFDKFQFLVVRLDVLEDGFERGTT